MSHTEDKPIAKAHVVGPATTPKGLETYEAGDDVYSTDMAIRWANEYGVPKDVPVSRFSNAINQYSWVDANETPITPKMVVDDRKNPAYKEHVKRLMNADLRYPILIHDGHIIDGFHRMTKAILQGHKIVKAVTIPDSVFRKFYVGSAKTFYDNPDKSLIRLLYKLLDDDEDKMYHTILDNIYRVRFNKK